MRRVLDPALLWLHIIPQIVLATALLTAGTFYWVRSERTPLVHALTLLVLFRGHLALVAAIVWLPEAPQIILRLWPVFDLAVVACSFTVLLFLMAHHFSAERMDGLLSSIIGGATLIAILLVIYPSLFWGNADGIGAFAFLDGLRVALGGAIAWRLLRLVVRGPSPDAPWTLPPRVAFLLSIAFVLPVMHWLVTDMLYIVAMRIPAVDLAAAVDHRGRLLGSSFLLLVAWECIAGIRAHARPILRPLVMRYIFAALVPALTSVLLLDLYVFGLIGSDLLGLAVASLFEALWVLAVPVAILFILSPPSRPAASRSSARAAAVAAWLRGALADEEPRSLPAPDRRT